MKLHKGKKVAGGKFVDVEEDANALEVIRVQKPKVVATVSGIKQLMTEERLSESNPFSSIVTVWLSFFDNVVSL